MNTPECQSVCHSLEALLDGTLPQPQVKTVEQHLEQCTQCQFRLEHESAESEFWERLPSLSDDEFDVDSISEVAADSFDSFHAGASHEDIKQRKNPVSAGFSERPVVTDRRSTVGGENWLVPNPWRHWSRRNGDRL